MEKARRRNCRRACFGGVICRGLAFGLSQGGFRLDSDRLLLAALRAAQSPAFVLPVDTHLTAVLTIQQCVHGLPLVLKQQRPRVLSDKKCGNSLVMPGLIRLSRNSAQGRGGG